MRAVAYSYDADGDLLQKTAPNQPAGSTLTQTTSSTYDPATGLPLRKGREKGSA